MYRIKTDVLRQLRPDLIVTQDQCEVCAVSYPEVEQAARACLGSEVTIVSLRPSKLEDILADIGRVASARSADGPALLHFRGRFERI